MDGFVHKRLYCKDIFNSKICNLYYSRIELQQPPLRRQFAICTKVQKVESSLGYRYVMRRRAKVVPYLEGIRIYDYK